MYRGDNENKNKESSFEKLSISLFLSKLNLVSFFSSVGVTLENGKKQKVVFLDVLSNGDIRFIYQNRQQHLSLEVITIIEYSDPKSVDSYDESIVNMSLEIW